MIRTWPLRVMTLMFFLTLSPFLLVLIKDVSKPQNSSVPFKSHRNERSTPRTFILPASPAVAFQQEKSKTLDKEIHIYRKCWFRMKDLGYDVGDFRDLSNVYFVSSIREIQNSHGIVPDGTLNIPTIKQIGC